MICLNNPESYSPGVSVSNERSDSPMGLFRIEIIYGLSQKALELDRCKRMAALVIRHMSDFFDG